MKKKKTGLCGMGMIVCFMLAVVPFYQKLYLLMGVFIAGGIFFLVCMMRGLFKGDI